ncbi:hypothetical protein DFJ73DRAFT_535427 [Zopfochytrium polystomum]|nr:hypothetical protein DFJ73DRAFT_535427 [Zopfochytrium polystomum]
MWHSGMTLKGLISMKNMRDRPEEQLSLATAAAATAAAATIGHLCNHLKHFPKSQSDDDQLDFVNEFIPCARFPLQSYGVDEDVFVNFMGWSGFTWSEPQRAALRFLVGLPGDGDRRPFSEADFASAFGLDDDKNSERLAKWVAISRASPLAAMDPLPWESLRGVLGAAFYFRSYVPSEIGDHSDRLFKVDLFKHKTFKFKAADRTLVSLVEFSAGRIAGVESR